MKIGSRQIFVGPYWPLESDFCR